MLTLGIRTHDTPIASDIFIPHLTQSPLQEIALAWDPSVFADTPGWPGGLSGLLLLSSGLPEVEISSVQLFPQAHHSA